MAAWRRAKKKRKTDKQADKIPHKTLERQEQKEMKGNLEETIEFLKEIMGDSDDFSIRKFSIFGKYPAAMFYISNLVDQTVVSNDLLKPLMASSEHLSKKELRREE